MVGGDGGRMRRLGVGRERGVMLYVLSYWW